MTDTAFRKSAVAIYLAEELQIPASQQFDPGAVAYDKNDGTALGWVREGSVSEDEYAGSGTALRFRNHFYDPLPGASNGGGLTLWGMQLEGRELQARGQPLK